MSDIGSIYWTTGRELEYSPLALDLYPECSHKCKYCYVDWSKQRKIFSLKSIENELRSLAFDGNNGMVTLSFVSDPYDRARKDNSLTRNVLKLFREYHHPFQILTKGGMIVAADFDLYGPEDRFGVTLTFDNDVDSTIWEPGAALPADRIESLKVAHERGVKTWVNLEPVIRPDQTLCLMEHTHPYVDFYIVGRWNHDKRADNIDWERFRDEAEALLVSLGKSYRIKRELL